MLILGVDPGVNGGWALVRLMSGQRLRLEQHGAVPRLPGSPAIDVIALARQWRGTVWTWPAVTAVIEAVSSRTGQGLVSTWAFGRSLGALEGVLAGLGVVDYVRVPPSAWKASYGLPGGKAGKQDSIELAERLMGERMDEHEAEAALLAWWQGQKIVQGTG